MNPVSARLLNQQLASPQFKEAAEVVSWFGAMQAQEYRLMRWAVSMRTKRPSAKDFETAYNEGRIVRGHLFRTTWQLVSGEDWRWMLDLCRVNALRGLAGWMKSNGVSIPAAEQDNIQLIFSVFIPKYQSRPPHRRPPGRWRGSVPRHLAPYWPRGSGKGWPCRSSNRRKSPGEAALHGRHFQ